MSDMDPHNQRESPGLIVSDMLRHISALQARPPLLVAESHEFHLGMRPQGNRQGLTDADRSEFQRSENAKMTGGYGYVVDAQGIATFNVAGVITPLQYAWGDGETVSEWITRDVDAATADTSVKGGLFVVNSPGGYVDGAYELADAIAAFGAAKPSASFCAGLGASAAYLQMAQTGHITAYKTALVGSIGTRSMAIDAEQMFRAAGVEIIPFDSGGMKSAGLIGTKITDEQKAYFLDKTLKLNAFFIDYFAAGRRLDRKTAEQLGDGRLHAAKDAKTLRLIDDIGTLRSAYQKLNDRVAAKVTTTGRMMTRSELTQQSGPATSPVQTNETAEAAAGDGPPPVGADAEPQSGENAPEKGSDMSQPTNPAPTQSANEPKPASITELKAAFANDPAFALEAAENAWTMDEARKMHGMITARTSKLEEENKSLREKQSAPRGGAGVQPVESQDRKPNRPQRDGDAIEQFNDAVAEQMKQPGYADRRKAIGAVMKRDPELHRSYLEQNNPSRKQRELIADKFDTAA